MKIKNIMNNLLFCQDLVAVFKNYSIVLDNYFENEKNIQDHRELYNYYVSLTNDIKQISKKNGVI